MEKSSSSSKVTVEYHDPYGVYQLLSPGLLPRLPLKNLHWESHAGPLRSISTLHIDLVNSEQASPPPVDTPSASSNDLSRVKSQDSTASGEDGFRVQSLGQAAAERPGSSGGLKRQKSRRHQIPGLRQTPYLKVFLLRCDDNETYKSQARKEVREWVKEHVPPSTSSSKVSAQENHDAFEYLIVHVIVPNTAAATQPRSSGKSADGSSGSGSEKARWRGGGSTTILEKLRADFNGTSKAAVDRVAQIRIGVNDVPYDMLPRVVPAIPGSYTESQQENENAWLDLILKFKALILASFDMRVSQYEEDIREKDAQRTLPGWNFCTFFVLKEGLARGFESVGLVEDALVGYDELSVGLDAIVREHRLRLRVGAGPQHGSSFLPFTEDLKKEAEKARKAILKDNGIADDADDEEPIDLQSNNAVPDRDVDEIPLNASKKRYRELILANHISIFDFRCYIFTRQLALLLRLANATSSQEELLAKLKEQRESSLHGVAARLPAAQPSEDAENLSILGEICRRAMEFVSSIARIMRDDIWAACMHGQQESAKEQARSDPVTAQVVDNIVSSFTFGVTQQILAQTSTKALPIPPSTLAPPSSTLAVDGQEQKTAIPEPKTMMHPARTSSLALRATDRGPQSPGIFPGGAMLSMQEQQAQSTFLKTGLEELATHRAEMYVLSRSVLEQAGKSRGWSSGWQEIAHLKGDDVDEMQEIDLSGSISRDEDEESEAKSSEPEVPVSLHGVSGNLFRTALQDMEDFYRLYETLTDKALRHFMVATRLQSVHSAMADLAVLKYHLQDFAAAASYFYQMTPVYGEDGWAQVEIAILVMYAKCLKELRRKEEFVRIALKLLAKSAMVEKERLKRKSMFRRIEGKDTNIEESTPSEPYLGDLLSITGSLQGEWEVPLENFFGSVEVDKTPIYHAEKDSFALQVHLRYLLVEDLSIEKGKIRLSQPSGETYRDVWLEMDGASVIKNGLVTLVFNSNVLVPGTYVVDFVGLYSNNIALQYDSRSTKVTLKDPKFFHCPKLLIYQRTESFDAQLYASRYMHLDRTRFLEIGLSSGWNDASGGQLNIRAATAGLRLQTSEAAVASGSLDLTTSKAEPGIVRFGSFGSNSSVRIRIPFTLEHEANDVSIRLEMSYTTEKGQFHLRKTLLVSIMLPLGVNVQDVFKHKALFSKFTISSATSSSLRLLGAQLEPSAVFGAERGVLPLPLTIYPRQPASILYKITRKEGQSKPQQTAKSKTSLSLVLNYICLEEEIDQAISQALEGTLQDSSLKSYTRLVLPVVTRELQARLNPYDLERVAVLSEIPTTPLSDVNWKALFAGLGVQQDGGAEIATLLSDKLQTWQTETPVVPLLPIDLDEASISKSRSIIIPVDVPSVSIVHTANLKLLDQLPIVSNSTVAALNQPIPASLEIKWTERWNTEAPASQAEDAEFFYEVSGPLDTWLIGGKRKGHFKVPRQGSKSEPGLKNSIKFPVVLIPLREGFLQYPNVEIKLAPVRSSRPGTASAEGGQKQPRITCETDYKNIGETIRCISDARKTTVSLDASGPQGGAWLLESERRTVTSG